MNLGDKAILCIVFIFVVFLSLEIISKENNFKRKCQHMNDVPFSAGAVSSPLAGARSEGSSDIKPSGFSVALGKWHSSLVPTS